MESITAQPNTSSCIEYLLSKMTNAQRDRITECQANLRFAKRTQFAKLKQYGLIKTAEMQKRRGNFPLEDAVRRAIAGEPYRSIAEDTGYHAEYVRQQVRSHPEFQRVEQERAEEFLGETIRLINEEGYNLLEASRIVNSNSNTIQQKLNKSGMRYNARTRRIEDL